MTDIHNLTSGLEQREDGIWHAATAEAVSYPEGGSALCFDIEDSSFWFAHRRAVIVDALRRFAPEPGAPFVDIGGGNGHVARGIADAGYPVILVEPSPVGALNARARGVADVVCATLESARFRPGSIALAGLFDVIEHIEDDVAALGALRAAMPPGGLVFLTVPAHQWLWSGDDQEAGHFRRYTRKSLEHTLQSAGFEVAHCTYTFAVLVAPILLLRALPSRLGRNFDADRSAKEHGKAGLLQRGIEKSLAWERHYLARGRALAFGASCLAIGRVPVQPAVGSPSV